MANVMDFRVCNNIVVECTRAASSLLMPVFSLSVRRLK